MLTNDEKFAAMMAVSKTVDKRMKDEKASLIHELEGTPADRRTFRAEDGTKLGVLSLTAPKVEPVIIDEKEAVKTLRALGLTKTVEVPVDGWQDALQVVGTDVMVKATGEIAEGFSVKYTKPVGRFTSFNEEQILEHLQPKLQGSTISMLMGGQDE